jgi:hypothetical protein
MSLEIIINEDIKKAMLAKDKRKLEALRAIKSALLIEKTGKGHGDEEIPESVEMKLLQKQVKQRMESAETYEQQGRKDLAEEERYQADIIKAYLPQQLDEAAIKAKVESIIKELGATSMKDMGKVMGVATKELAGKADNSIISKFVKDALG